MWSKFDDALLGHPKVLSAGQTIGASKAAPGKNGVGLALGFYAACILYTNRYLTDGFLSDAGIENLGCAERPADAAAALVAAKLLDRVDGGYRIHDYHDHNHSAESVRKKRKADRERKLNEKKDS